MIKTIDKILQGLGTQFSGGWAKIIGGDLYPPSPGICTPAKNQDEFSKFFGLDLGKKYEKSRQKLTQKSGPGF
jgi:hypothetical protein